MDSHAARHQIDESAEDCAARRLRISGGRAGPSARILENAYGEVLVHRLRFKPAILCAFALLPAIPALAAPLRVVGTDLLAPAVERLLADRAVTPPLEIELKLTGTRPGADALERVRADAALLIGAAIPQGGTRFGFRRIPFAHVVAFVVAASPNPIESIEVRQIAAVFRTVTEGSIQQWGQAGVTGDWKLRTIAPMIAAPRQHAVAGYLQQAALGGNEYGRGVEFLASPREIPDRLTGTWTALVVSPLPPPGRNAKVLAVAGDSSAGPVVADAASIESGRYPLAIPVEIVYRDGTDAAVAPLVRVLFSSAAAAAFEQALFHPLSPASRQRILEEFGRR